MESLIAMSYCRPEPEFKDRTIHVRWIQEQVDRLSGWECLQMALGRGDGDLDESEIEDKLGVSSTFCYNLMKHVRIRLLSKCQRKT